jgi:predicted ATPase
MKIDLIQISGFKSIANLRLEGLEAFSAFAGPNGAGKSNVMDALAFVSAVVDRGAVKALQGFGGIRAVMSPVPAVADSRTFDFALQTTLQGHAIAYTLKVHTLDAEPFVEERLEVDGQCRLSRSPAQAPAVFMPALNDFMSAGRYPGDRSALMFTEEVCGLYRALSNLMVFRLDPWGSRTPTAAADGTALHPDGHNLAAVLGRLQSNDSFRLQVEEWLSLLVPGLEHISAEQDDLDGSVQLRFKERHSPVQFTQGLMSDGTLAALSILTAVLSRAGQPGITVIEEPERGLHPKAIEALADLMRQNANLDHPIFVTTHSESLVRACRADELWLVNKMDGKTVAKNAATSDVDLGTINLDTAWLMNLFDGGLPW